MKRILLLVTIILIYGCSNPQNIAEKALKEIGSGKYKSDSFGLCFEKIKIFNNTIYSNCEIQNHKSKYGYSDKLDDIYFQTDRLFDNYIFVDKRESNIDLYHYTRFSFENNNDTIFYNEFIKSKMNLTNFKQDSASCQYLEYKDVDVHNFRYKIENKYIVNIHVLDHPEYGFVVSGFTYE